jgi:hypothetical protein
MGSVAKLRKGFLIYEEMRKYLTKYEVAVSHIWLCNRSILNFLIYEENFILFFISVPFISWYVLNTKLYFNIFVSILSIIPVYM